MRKFIAIAVSFLAVGASSNCFAEKLTQGSVFLHTLRNTPTIFVDGVETDIKQGSLIKAKGLKIECKKDEYASVKFSNSVVVIINENTSLKIDEFEQIQPFVQNHSTPKETNTSILKVSLERGSLAVLSKERRARSKFEIYTRAGVFSMNATQFLISDNAEKVSITIIEGSATFVSKSGKKDFLRNKQYAEVKNKDINANYPLSIDQLGMLEEEKVKDFITPCKQIQDSILFEFDKDDNLKAKRLIFKEFLLKRSKYQHRN